MTFEQFSQAVEMPAGLNEPLQALWLAGKGEWDLAHDIVKNLSTPEGARVHAWLHRQEGDESNAAYWYQQAGQNYPTKTLGEEWAHIVRNYLFANS